MKKALSLILTLVLLLGLMPQFTLPVSAAEPEENKWAGKKVSILSHSMSTYAGVSNSTAANSTLGNNDVYYTAGRHDVYREDTWWQQVIDALGMELLVNNSWSGSCVFMPRKGEASVGYGDRAVNLHNDHTGEEPDVIFVYLGCNDFAYYKDTFGKADDVNYVSLIHDNGDGTFSYAVPQTTCEAYAIMLHKIENRYPDAEVYCMTSTARRETDYTGDSYPDAGQPTEYSAQLQKVASYFGYPVIDLENAIAKDVEIFDKYIGDKRAHANALGMDQITNEVLSVMLGKDAEICHVICEDGTVQEQAVLLGGRYYTDVKLQEGYSVVVTMGGKNITAEAYNNGKISIEEVTGDIAIIATRNPFNFRWEIQDDKLVSVGYTENDLSKLAGTVANGVLNNTRYQLATSVVLKHDLPWEVEWKFSGNWRGCVFTSDPVQNTKGMVYLSRTVGGQLTFGTWTGKQYDNYGVDLSYLDDQFHTYRLENRIAADGSNMVWVYVDGEEIGPMNHYYIGSKDQGKTSDWISGKNFEFSYISMDGHALKDCQLDYLQVQECVHTYENGICSACDAEHPNRANYEGKVISILGDSISTFAGYIPVADGFNLAHKTRYPQDNLLTDVNETWWMQIINNLDAKLGINDSWASSEVYNYIDAEVNSTSDGTKACMASVTRIQNLGSNGTPDVILFFGGTNDITQSRPLGTFDPVTAPTEVDLTSVKWDTVADAYVDAIMRMQYYYPDAQIVAMLPYYRNSQGTAKVDKYNNLFASICEHYGVAYVDLRHCGITGANIPDGTHPDADGMDYITDAVLDLLMSDCNVIAGEHVVHSVTHNLNGAKSTLGYYKGISHGNSFTTTITGDDFTVTVTMGGVDITADCYANGVISIDRVTGDLVITAEGRPKTVYADYLQKLPTDLCCGTNLWTALKPINLYYRSSGWGLNATGLAHSITFPVSAGDQIWATSFQESGLNGGTKNGIALTWFDTEGVIETFTPEKTYAEFAKNGYLTAPEGAVAVNVVMWNGNENYEVYILNRDHGYENGNCTACGAAQWDTDGDGVLEILAIGNSFSVDALQYAYQIAQNLGIEEIVLGNLYIGGCSLNTHATNAAGDLAKYTYYYNDNGTWKTTSNYKISTALESRSWDYVSLQQASNYSGVESTYNKDLTNLITYVKDRSDAKLVWHMTWAYQQNSTHSAFPTYNKDQMTMYNAIVSAVQNKIVTNSNFDLIVPNGTAVQNSRTSLLGDTTTRDGYHMSYDYGRYLTGLLFIKSVTGLSVDNITYAPSGVDAQEKAIAIESVNNAFAKPFAVTNSVYTGEAPEEGYVLLQPELYKGAYWYPTDAKNYNTLVTDADNSKYYFATIRFTRETLPVGSIIFLADGWQYRPDGWITDTRQTGTREPVTTAPYVVITEEWWGDYTIRAFNISKVGTPSLMNLNAEDIHKVFRIYVPEESHSHTYENGICTLCGAAQPGPVIVTQPTDAEAALGENYCVTVVAKGEGLTYQWYFRNAGSSVWYKSSVKDNTYDDVMTKARAGREVYCVITDANGNTVTTDTVKLICTPSVELEIVTQPTNGEAVLGERYCVTVEAKGEGLKYQWYFRNAGSSAWYKSSVKDNTYDDVMTTARAGREVYCVVTDAYGNSVKTDVVKLIRIPVKLEIISQPTDATAAFGEMFCATVEAKGEGLKYQWYYRNAGSDKWYTSGVRDNTYDDIMTKARNGREVYCVITDKYGNTVTTDTVKLIAIPKVELKLLGQTYESAVMGERYCVTVEAQGEGLTYQWYFRNAGSNTWYKSSVKDNTYDDVMTKSRANREVYCVITDQYGNQIVTEVVTIWLNP